MQKAKKWRDWNDLNAEEQVGLRADYGRHADTEPPTCDLALKIERFRDWLALRWIRYP